MRKSHLLAVFAMIVAVLAAGLGSASTDPLNDALMAGLADTPEQQAQEEQLMGMLSAGIADSVDANFTFLVENSTITPYSYQDGTLQNTYFSNAIKAMRLNAIYSAGNFTSQVFYVNPNASWINISWLSSAIGELPNCGASETEYGSGNANMSNIVMLFHLNNDSSAGENNTHVVDFSGNGYDGAASGNSRPNATIKKLGAASFEFDGTSGYIDTGLTPSQVGLNGSTPKTVSVWAYVRAYNNGGLFEFGTQSTAQDFSLRTLGSANQWRAQFWSTPDFDFTYDGTNKWSHYVAVHNGTAGIVYINGQEYASEASTISTTNTKTVRVGVWNGNVFNGLIDEIAFYNRTLTAQEIQDLYKRGVTRLNLSVRTCDDSACSGESWTDITDESPQTLSLDDKPYFQYKAEFETDNLSYSPYLYNATISYTPQHTHVVTDTPAGTTFVLADNTSANASQESQTGIVEVLNGEVSSGEYAGALWIDFSSNVSVSGMTLDVDRGTAKSVLHNTSGISGIINRSLLVPKVEGSGKVVICEGASSLSEVSIYCSNKIIMKTGQTSGSMHMSEVTYDALDYYKISGITGTGGQENNGTTNFMGYPDVKGTTTGTATLRCQPVNITEAGVLESISMYLSGTIDGNITLGIYDFDHRGTQPGTLLAESATTPAVSGWNVLPMQNTVKIENGSYCLAWFKSSSNPLIHYDTGTPGRWDAGGYAYDASGMPDDFPSGSQSGLIYSIHANYTVYDEVAPSIADVADFPDPIIAGSIINISANITDGNAVGTALIEIQGTNYSMSPAYSSQSSVQLDYSYIVDDGYYDQDNAVDGSENILIADAFDGTGEQVFIKFDTSSIPANSNVINATLCLHTNGSEAASDENLDIYSVDYELWTEEQVDNNPPNPTTFIRNYSGTDGADGWDCIDSLNIAITEQTDKGDNYVSFLINHTGDILDYYRWFSKEEQTYTQYRPYLNITYQAPRGTYYYEHNTTGLYGNYQYTIYANDSYSNAGTASGNFTSTSQVLNVAIVCGSADCTGADTDVPLKNYLNQTLGFNVTTHSSATFNTNSYDIVVVSESVSSSSVAWLKTEEVGILTVEGASNDEFDLGTSGSSSGGGSTDVNITNNTHYITQPYSLGLLTVSTVSSNAGSISGWSNDVHSLAYYDGSPTLSKLLVVEKGGTLTDSTNATDRRAFFGAQYFANLNENGKEIFTRAAYWAANATEAVIPPNNAPTHTAPVLNSTLGTNLTSENLTCYNQSTADADNEDVKNLFSWYKNGSALTVLNMPFEGGSNSTYTKDYSPSGYDGSVQSGAIWSSTGGYDGKGAYEFDGTSNAYIDTSTDLTGILGSTASISVWFKTEDIGSDSPWLAPGIAGSEQGGGGNDIFWGFIDESGDIGFQAGDGASIKSTSAVNDGEWHHLVITRNHASGAVNLYLDGVLNNSGTSDTGGKTTSFTTIGSMANVAQYWNGTLDDLIVFNASLSAEQARALYENRTDLIVSNETSGGEVWQCEVTPNDGEDDGTTLQSNNLTIVADDPSTTLSCWEAPDPVEPGNYFSLYCNYTDSSGNPLENGSNAYCQWIDNASLPTEYFANDTVDGIHEIEGQNQHAYSYNSVWLELSQIIGKGKMRCFESTTGNITVDLCLDLLNTSIGADNSNINLSNESNRCMSVGSMSCDDADTYFGAKGSFEWMEMNVNMTEFHNLRTSLGYINNPPFQFPVADIQWFYHCPDCLGSTDRTMYPNATGAEYNNTKYNASEKTLQLNNSYNGTFYSEILDEQGEIGWNNISWVVRGPYGVHLPANQAVETEYISGNANMTQNNVLFYMNESSGTIIDYSGRGNDGTQSGGVTYGVGTKFGTGISFDGVDDGISIANTGDINLGIHTEYAVEVWFKANNKEKSSAKQMLYEQGGGTRGLNIYLYNSALFVGGWNGRSSESDWQGTWHNTTSIEDGKWHHVVLVLVNGTDTIQPDRLKGYLDGQEFGSGDGSQLWGHSGGIEIGANDNTKYHDGSGNNDDSNFNGTIDEFAHYNRSLSAAEIVERYKRGAVRLNVSIRTCNNSDCNNSPWNETYTESPQAILAADNQYFQYKVDMASDSILYTPEMYNFTVNYNADFWQIGYDQDDTARSAYESTQISGGKRNWTQFTGEEVDLISMNLLGELINMTYNDSTQLWESTRFAAIGWAEGTYYLDYACDKDGYDNASVDDSPWEIRTATPPSCTIDVCNSTVEFGDEQCINWTHTSNVPLITSYSNVTHNDGYVYVNQETSLNFLATMDYKLGLATALCYVKNSNSSAVNSTNFTIADTTPPTIELTSPTNGTIHYSISQFDITTYDAHADAHYGMNCSLYINSVLNDSITNQTDGQLQFSVPVSSEGNYTWYVNCTDFSGNSNISGTRAFTIDQTNPVSTLVSPEAGYTNSTIGPINLTFVCNATDNEQLDNIQLYITNASNQSFGNYDVEYFSTASASANWTIELENGNYTWNCLATDDAGNTDWAENRTMELGIDINDAPTHTAPILNSSNGTNYSTENLTCWNQSTADADNDEVKNVFNWKRNGTAVTVLNMPFEGGSNSTYTKDYSGNSNDGNVSGASWNATGGYDGKGDYEFDGASEYIITESSFTVPSQGTVEFYMRNKSDVGGTQRLFGTSDGFEFRMTDGTIYTDICITGGNTNSFTKNVWNDSAWHHLVMTWDDSTNQWATYVDGQLDNSGTDAAIDCTGVSDSLMIGASNRAGSPTGYFSGTIDEFRIYSIALSADQILALYENRTDLIVSQETSTGDVWQCEVTPNDGELDGTTLPSNNLTVLAPTADILAPAVENVQPSAGSSYNLSVNATISAAITDASSISYAYANVTLPNGTVETVTITDSGGGNYTGIFSNMMLRGRYNITFYANDTEGNANGSETTWFNRIVPQSKIFDVVDTGLNYENYTINVMENASGILTLEINISGHKVSRIVAEGHDENSFYSVIRVENSTNDDPYGWTEKTFMVDLSGANLTSANVTMTSEGYHLFKCVDFNITTMQCNDDDNYTQIRTGLTDGQEYTITLTALDPGFYETIQGAGNTSDSRLRSGSGGDDNYGGRQLIRVGRSTAANIHRGIIWFNLSHIPTNAVVESANVSLYFGQIPGSDSNILRTHGIHRVQQSPARDWVELEATWLNYTATNPWTSSGGDYNATATDTQTFNSSDLNTWITYDITADAQNFVSLPSTNFGWIIRDTTEDTDATRRDYASSENSNANIRPILYISYTVDNSPTHTTPVLNSSGGGNTTYETLTCWNQSTSDPNGDDVKNIYGWYRNGSSIIALNMPFENNTADATSSTKDYSPNSNNGTVSGAAWNSTGGYEGKGAYEFDGTDDYINLSDNYEIAEGTIAFWVKLDLTVTTGWAGNYRPWGKDGDFEMRWNDADGLLDVDLGGGPTMESTTATWNAGEWYHIAATWTAESQELYVNGALEDTGAGFTPTDTAFDFLIGQSGENAGPFNGTIDEFVIYNISLSAEQIDAIYENRTDEIVSQETSLNDTWQCEITPNDGSQDGSLLQSNTLAIINDTIPPTVTLNQPPGDYWNDTTSLHTFNCSAEDNAGLFSLDLYLTNQYNESFSLRDTEIVSGSSASAQWDIYLAAGNYSWNCKAMDIDGNTAFASQNRTIRLNYSDVQDPNATLNNPDENFTCGTNCEIDFSCTATDDYFVENLSLYISNSSGEGLLLNQSTAIRSLNGTAEWELGGFAEGNYTWNCLADDGNGNTAFAQQNRTFEIRQCRPLNDEFGIYAGYSEYIIPMPEETIWWVYDNLPDSPPANEGTHTVITVTASLSQTTVYYDHWEDGYDFDPENPSATADEIVVLSQRGSYATFENASINATPRDSSEIYYDGGDRLYTAGGPVTVVRASWPESSGTVLSMSVEVFPVKALQKFYTIPVGEDLGMPPYNYEAFDSVYLIVQAVENNTRVVIDDPKSAGIEIDVMLDRGEATNISGIYAGTTVNATKKVNVQFVVGDPTENYEVRGYTAVPDSLWSNEYYSPVGSFVNATTDLYLYNPYDSPTNITVQYEDLNNSGVFVIPPKSTRSYYNLTGTDVPINSGVYLNGDSPFWGIAAIDANSSEFDWGFSLVPVEFLTRDYYIGWAPGSSNTPPTESGSPIYVTVDQSDTTIMVDYGPNDGVVDATYTLDRLETVKIFDPDFDNTGMHIYTQDNKKYALAWGEDPDTATPFIPYLDLGYTIIPLSVEWLDVVLGIEKYAAPSTVSAGPGQNVTFSLIVSAQAYDVFNVDAFDILPAVFDYANGSTYVQLPNGTVLNGGSTEPTVSGRNLTWDLNINLTTCEHFTINFTATSNSNLTYGFYWNDAWAQGERDNGNQIFTPIVESRLEVEFFSIDKDAGIPAIYPGGVTNYSIKLKNIGNDTLTQVNITDTLPPGFTFINQSILEQGVSRGLTINPSPGNRTLNWGTWNISPGGNLTINFHVQVANDTQGGTYDNTVIAASNETGEIDDIGSIAQDAHTPGGEDPENDEDVTVTAIAEIAVAKTDNVDPVLIGQYLIYTINVTNNGPSNATNLSVKDTLPPEVIFNSATPSPNSSDGNTYYWDYSTLAIDASTTITINVTVNHSTNGFLSNLVNVTSAYEDSLPGNNVDNETTKINLPPYVELNSPPNGTNTSNSTVEFNWTATDDTDTNLTCNLTIDGVVNASGIDSPNATPTTYTVPGFSDGTHYWNVTCADDAGNVNSSETWEFTVDTNGLIVNLNTPSDGYNTSDTTVNFNWTAVDNVDTLLSCNLTIDGVVNVSYVSSPNGTPTNYSVGEFADGVHTWNVTCADDAGNVNSSETWTFTVDTDSINVVQNSPPNGYNTSNTTITFNWTATDNLDPSLDCNLTIDGVVNASGIASPNGTPTTYTVAGFEPGVHNWSVQCVDDTGNTANTTTWVFTLDIDSITVVQNSPPNGYNTSNNTVEFNWTATDDFDPYPDCDLIIDGFVNVSGVSSQNATPTTYTVPGFSDGLHTWAVNCSDDAGNYNTTTTWNFTIDTGGINVVQNSPPNGYNTTNNTIVFNWTATDNLDPELTCDLIIDGIVNVSGISSPNGTPTTYTLGQFADGLHTWQVNCSDDSGNSDITTVWNFTVDTTPPVVELVMPPEDHYNDTSGYTNFTCNATDNEGLENISLYITDNQNSSFAFNQSTAVSGTSASASWMLNLSIGNYTWNCIAYDTIGLFDWGENRTIKINYTIDEEPPTVIQNSPPNGTNTSNNTIVFNWTATDDIDLNLSCDLIIDGIVNVSGIDSPNGTHATYTVPGIADGTHVWQVNCSDDAGNYNTTGNWTFTIDSTPPNIILIQPQPGTEYNQTNTSTIIVNVTDNFNVDTVLANVTWDSTSELITLINTGGNLYEGNFSDTILIGRYNISIIANDTFGNVNDSLSTHIFVNDVTPPNIIIITPTNGTKYGLNENITIQVNVTDAYYDYVDVVYANVSIPGDGYQIVTLVEIDDTQIFEGNFTNTSVYGIYNFTIFANDTSANANSENGYFEISQAVQVVVGIACTLTETPQVAESGEKVLLQGDAAYTDGTPAVLANISEVNVTIYRINGSNRTVVDTGDMIFIQDGIWYYEFDAAYHEDGNYMGIANIQTNEVPPDYTSCSALFTISGRGIFRIVGISPDMVNVNTTTRVAAEITLNGEPVESSKLVNPELWVQLVNGSVQHYNTSNGLGVGDGIVYLDGFFNNTGVYYLNWSVSYYNRTKTVKEVVAVTDIADVTVNNSAVEELIRENQRSLSGLLREMEKAQEFDEEQVFLITDSINSLSQVSNLMKSGKMTEEEAREEVQRIQRVLNDRFGDRISGYLTGPAENGGVDSGMSIMSLLMIALLSGMMVMFVSGKSRSEYQYTNEPRRRYEIWLSKLGNMFERMGQRRRQQAFSPRKNIPLTRYFEKPASSFGRPSVREEMKYAADRFRKQMSYRNYAPRRVRRYELWLSYLTKAFSGAASKRRKAREEIIEKEIQKQLAPKKAKPQELFRPKPPKIKKAPRYKVIMDAVRKRLAWRQTKKKLHIREVIEKGHSHTRMNAKDLFRAIDEEKVRESESLSNTLKNENKTEQKEEKPEWVVKKSRGIELPNIYGGLMGAVDMVRGNAGKEKQTEKQAPKIRESKPTLKKPEPQLHTIKPKNPNIKKVNPIMHKPGDLAVRMKKHEGLVKPKQVMPKPRIQKPRQRRRIEIIAENVGKILFPKKKQASGKKINVPVDEQAINTRLSNIFSVPKMQMRKKQRNRLKSFDEIINSIDTAETAGTRRNVKEERKEVAPLKGKDMLKKLKDVYR